MCPALLHSRVKKPPDSKCRTAATQSGSRYTICGYSCVWAVLCLPANYWGSYLSMRTRKPWRTTSYEGHKQTALCGKEKLTRTTSPPPSRFSLSSSPHPLLHSFLLVCLSPSPSLSFSLHPPPILLPLSLPLSSSSLPVSLMP